MSQLDVLFLTSFLRPRAKNMPKIFCGQPGDRRNAGRGGSTRAHESIPSVVAIATDGTIAAMTRSADVGGSTATGVADIPTTPSCYRTNAVPLAPRAAAAGRLTTGGGGGSASTTTSPPPTWCRSCQAAAAGCLTTGGGSSGKRTDPAAAGRRAVEGGNSQTSATGRRPTTQTRSRQSAAAGGLNAGGGGSR